MSPLSSPPDAGSGSGTNPWFAATLGLLGIIIGFVFGTVVHGNPVQGTALQPAVQVASSIAAAAQPPAATAAIAPIDPKTDRIQGDLSKATVAVVEYSDFECPFCKALYEDAEKQVMSTYGDKVVWVYRDFPLSFHQNAHKEAEAGRCVFALGGNDAFWKFHDYVFTKTTSNGTGFPLDQLPVAAKQAGVDITKFQSCLDNGTYAKAVHDQESEGSAAGVNGTPGNFIVNLKTQKSTSLEGAQPFSAFKTAIDAVLAQ